MPTEFAQVNGVRTAVPNDDRRLLDWIREDLGRTAPKEGCGAGHCGACTVLVDRMPVLACCSLAAATGGSEILLADAIAETTVGTVLADEFARHGALQCGYCTPGMLTAAYALLIQCDAPPTYTDIQLWLVGNVCRCTGYTPIIDAVLAASRASHG